MTFDLSSLKRELRLKATTPQRRLEIAALDPTLSRALAKWGGTTPDQLAVLASNADMQTRRAVAAHPATPPELLDQLSFDKQWTVLKEVAARGDTKSETLERLTRHPRSTVRAATLENPNRPASLLYRFSRDPDPVVRAAAVLDKNQSPEMALELARDVAGLVRAAALSHSGTNQTLLDQGLIDPDGQVRAAALTRLTLSDWATRLSEDQLNRLTDDPDVRVRRIVADTVARLVNLDDLTIDQEFICRHLADRLIDDPDRKVREGAVIRASPERLGIYADDPSLRMRRWVASRCSVLSSLAKLVHDESDSVKSSLLYNPALTAELSAELVVTIKDNNSLISAAKYLKLSDLFFEALLVKTAFLDSLGFHLLDIPHFPSHLRLPLMEDFAHRQSDSHRSSVARQPDIPHELAYLLMSSSESVEDDVWTSRSLARNIHIPTAIHRQLSYHHDPETAEFACATLARKEIL